MLIGATLNLYSYALSLSLFRAFGLGVGIGLIRFCPISRDLTHVPTEGRLLCLLLAECLRSRPCTWAPILLLTRGGVNHLPAFEIVFMVGFILDIIIKEEIVVVGHGALRSSN